jgi:hypothetical protein
VTAWARTAVSTALAAAIVAAVAGAVRVPAAVAGPAGGEVRVATTGDHAELRETIPVTKTSGAERRVAMSLDPGRLPSLRPGDRLRVASELQTTNNCRKRSPFCVGRPYRYSPKIGTRLVLAGRAGATHGPGVLPVSDRKQITCGQSRRNREHHCVSVFGGASIRIGNEVPCELDRCRVNLVVDAHRHGASAGDVVLLGIDRADGSVRGDRGRINVTRLRGPDAESRVQATHRRLRTSMRVEKGRKATVYSLRLGRLREGEQLTFEALATAGIGHLPYAAFVGSQLILAQGRRDVRTTALTRSVASLDGEVSEGNGFNCTQRASPCAFRRVGTLVMRKTPRRHGEAIPLFVNLVLRNAPKQLDDAPGDRIRIASGGGIEARRYPASARG